MTSYGSIEFEADDRRPQITVAEGSGGGGVPMPISQSVDRYLLQQPTSARRLPYVYDGGTSAATLWRDVSQTSVQQQSTSRGGGGSGEGGNDVVEHTTVDPHRDHNMALRYRFYNRLDPGGQNLMMPAHVIPGAMFSILPFDELLDQQGKQGSIVTIFSIWNTMMGTSLLAMPWALQQSGLVLGLLLMLGMAALALYTAYRFFCDLPVDPDRAEFSDVCAHFWGAKGELVAVSFSVLVLLGGAIVYFILMSNFLFYSGNIVREALRPNSTIIPVLRNETFACDIYCPVDGLLAEDDLYQRILHDQGGEKSLLRNGFDAVWTLQGGVPVILAVCVFPLLNFRSPTFFMKFNILGTISVLFLVFFTLSKLADCGVNLSREPTSPHYFAVANWRFPALTGTLALSYFIHNAVLTILKNQKRPENNARDLCVGYGLACASYVLIGTSFFVAFPLGRRCIADNLLNNFGPGDLLSATTRVFLLFQMLTILPLLVYLIRVQFSYLFTGTAYPGLPYVLLTNLGVVGLATLCAVVYPRVGGVLRFVGSASGLVYVFALPSLVHLRRLSLFGGEVSARQKLFHYGIVALGVVNLLLQFFI